MRATITSLTLLRVALSSPAFAEPRVQGLLNNLPLHFVENGGQEDPRVAYYVPGKSITTYFTADGVTFAFSSPPPPARPGPTRVAARPAEYTRAVPAALTFVTNVRAKDLQRHHTTLEITLRESFAGSLGTIVAVLSRERTHSEPPGRQSL